MNRHNQLALEIIKIVKLGRKEQTMQVCNSPVPSAMAILMIVFSSKIAMVTMQSLQLITPMTMAISPVPSAGGSAITAVAIIATRSSAPRLGSEVAHLGATRQGDLAAGHGALHLAGAVAGDVTGNTGSDPWEGRRFG